MTGLSRVGGGVSGMLWVHLLAGRGLRPPAEPPSPADGSGMMVSVPPRDLYCVLECDRVHKARTVVSNFGFFFLVHLPNTNDLLGFITRYGPENFSLIGMNHLNWSLWTIGN